MDLDTLVQILRKQAGDDDKVTFDKDFLTDTQIDALRAGFALDSKAFLTIDGITAGDIPDPSNDEVVLTAGTVAVLSQSGMALRVVFTVDTTKVLQFTIAVDLPESWQFKDSFEQLTLFPFDQVTASESRTIYATRTVETYFPWPAQPTQSVALAPGLNIATWLQLDIFKGAMTLLKQIINGSDKYKFFGPVVPGGEAYPVMNLVSPLAAQSFTIVSGLSIGDLALAIDVSPPLKGIQNLSMRLQAGTQDLAFGVEMLSENLVLSFFAEPRPGHTFGVNQILALPGGSGFQQYVPSTLGQAFDAALLQSFVITQAADLSIGTTGFVIGSNPGYTLTLIDQVLILTMFRMEMSSYLPGKPESYTSVSFAANAKIFQKLFPGDFRFLLEISKTQQSGWQIDRITGSYLGEFKLSDVVDAIVGSTTLLPSALANIRFANFGVDVQHQEAGYTYTLYGEASDVIPIMDGTELIASLQAVATYAPDGYTVKLLGTFLIGKQNFQLELDLGKSNTPAPQGATIVLKANWHALDETGYLQFEDIATALQFPPSEIPTIPKDLNLNLKQANFYYDFTNQTLLMGCVSDTYGKADFAAVKDPTTKKWQFFFGLNVDKPIPISNLPLISDILPKENTVEINQIQVVIASAKFDDALAKQMNEVIGGLKGGYPLVPDNDGKGMPAGLGFAMKVMVGTYEIPIMFGAGQSAELETPEVQALIADAMAPLHQGRALIIRDVSPDPRAPVTGAASSDGVTWFNLQKTFGPVSIQKIGVQYKDERIWVLVNMALTGGGLTIGLLGFGIGSPISSFEPKFTISGIDITYSAGTVVVSGGLRGSIDPVVNFVGELMVKAQAFGIAVLAGYTSYEGQPSMFLYAVLNAPLGGPACFFVTGLAGGFGYNRDLQFPDVSGVSTFPLVEWAQGDNNPPGMDMTGNVGEQVNQVLERLADSGVVAPRVGQYWLAVGVKFTSFQLANSFALAVVKFGQEFEIDLLGVTTIAIPPAAPVVFAELQLLASFRPAEGFVGIAGQLTPRSYVLAPECHLTGGFAYYFWFSGPLAGNFIATMGGYSPYFKVPDFYPKVPRLGINWKVSDKISIKGEEYFAVTSAAVMAGGGLSATWDSGGIKAWFNVQAHFLMVYQPFHYYITASVDIGASFRVNLLFTHITVSIHVGATLEIWGPEFTGRATIDLSIVSFTISFGASGQNTKTTISWNEFATTMLPGQTKSDAKRRRMAALAGAPRAGNAATDDSGIHINVQNGLVKSLTDEAGKLNFVVGPEAVEITVMPTIPIKEKHATFSGLVELAPEKDQPKDKNGQPIKPNDAFGVGPAGVANDNFIPTFEMSITLDNPEADDEGPLITLQCVRMLSNAPNALWKKIGFDSHGNPQLGDPLKDTGVPDVIMGYRIVPVVLDPQHTLPIYLEYLQYTISPHIQHYAWSTAYVPTTDDFTPSQTVETTIMSPTARANRAVLLPVLNKYIPDIATTVDLDTMTDSTHAALLAQPVLRLLGEEKAAA